MYRPQGRRGGHRVPAVRRLAQVPVVQPAAPPVRKPLASVEIAPDPMAIPRPARMPAIQLEPVAARAPRAVFAPPAESTPALAFDMADSGAIPARITMPVPRAVPSASKLPYLASGVLALAAGALVVLLAGLGRPAAAEFPATWSTGAVARSAAAVQPSPASVPPIAPQITIRPLPADFAPAPSCGRPRLFVRPLRWARGLPSRAASRRRSPARPGRGRQLPSRIRSRRQSPRRSPARLPTPTIVQSEQLKSIAAHELDTSL